MLLYSVINIVSFRFHPKKKAAQFTSPLVEENLVTKNSSVWVVVVAVGLFCLFARIVRKLRVGLVLHELVPPCIAEIVVVVKERCLRKYSGLNGFLLKG